jgi:DNA-binding NarL/FixJ family response regulator
MDINMPVMNGIEATREIKAAHPAVVVISLSMHDAGQMAEAMGKSGADQYLSKGENASTLCAAIRSIKWDSRSEKAA